MTLPPFLYSINDLPTLEKMVCRYKIYTRINTWQNGFSCCYLSFHYRRKRKWNQRGEREVSVSILIHERENEEHSIVGANRAACHSQNIWFCEMLVLSQVYQNSHILISRTFLYVATYFLINARLFINTMSPSKKMGVVLTPLRVMMPIWKSCVH